MSAEAQAAQALCQAVCSSTVDRQAAINLQNLANTCWSLRLALADVLDGCAGLTTNLLTPGPLSVSLHAAERSCVGRVMLSAQPCLLSHEDEAQAKHMAALTDLAGSEGGHASTFFCVPILQPAAAGPEGEAAQPPAALGALLAEFDSTASVTPSGLKACLLLAAALVSGHADALQACRGRLAAALAPEEGGPGWGLALGTLGSHSPTSSEADSGEEGHDALDRFQSEELARAQAAEQRDAAQEAAARVARGMNPLTLRFASPRNEAAYRRWRHRQLVLSDALRLIFVVACYCTGILFRHPPLTLAILKPLTLLCLALGLRLVPTTQQLYARQRNCVIAVTLAGLLANFWQNWALVLGTLPSHAWQERLMKIALLWMVGMGTTLQVEYPHHVALLVAAAGVCWAAHWEACPVVRPWEWFPGCLVVWGFKVLVCQVVIPLAAIYFTELGERRLWLNTVWQQEGQHEE